MRHEITLGVTHLALSATLVLTALAADPPRVVRLDVEVENIRVYRFDATDVRQRASTPTAVAPITNATNTFVESVAIGDIVSVNGRPAKGVWQNRGTPLNFTTSQQTGRSISDVMVGNNIGCVWEFYTSDATFVGSFVDRGLNRHLLLGGGGSFLGAVGEHHTGPGGQTTPLPNASMSEDPSLRRTMPTGRWNAYIDFVPKFWPKIELLADGPGVFHSDWTPVSSSNPARPGELLVVRATGLGATKPTGNMPGLLPFPEEPLEEVSSPVEVTVGGRVAQVVNKVGWPGERDLYRIDIRMPAGVEPGPARLLATAGWVPGDPVTISTAR